jgi:hypothetical protein
VDDGDDDIDGDGLLADVWSTGLKGEDGMLGCGKEVERKVCSEEL